MIPHPSTVSDTGPAPSSARLAEETDKIRSLETNTDMVILEISAVFPFQLFPDRLIIDSNKASIIRKQFLYKRIYPILLEDILTLRVTRSLLFASMEIEVRGFEQNPSILTHLWPDHAAMAKQLVVGLMKAKREKIDLSLFTPQQIRYHMMNIGKTSDEVNSLT